MLPLSFIAMYITADKASTFTELYAYIHGFVWAWTFTSDFEGRT
jgi:hypothetical protein